MKDILLIRLNRPHRKPVADEKQQTAYDRCRVITLPDQFVTPSSFNEIKWVITQLEDIREVRPQDQNLFFNIAICIAINYAYVRRQEEKSVSVWFDDVKLEPQCLGNCATYLDYNNVDGLGLPFEGRFKQLFARFFIYRMEKWGYIDWRTLWKQTNYPELYIAFQDQLRQTKGLITRLVDRKGQLLNPLHKPTAFQIRQFLLENRDQLGGVHL